MLKRRKAFTIIEIMLVVGVLVILIGIVVWALKGAGEGGAAKSTGTTLQNLTGMSEELGRKNKFAGFDLLYPPMPSPPSMPMPMGFEVAPGMVTDKVANTDRFGDAVRRTCEVMIRIQSIPDNKRLFEKFPADQVLAVPPGMYFSNLPSAGGTVLLDGWHNPIIFVPSTGLKSVISKQKTSTYSPGNNYTRGARVVHGAQATATNLLVFWTARKATTNQPSEPDWFEGIQSPDARPFWASAGPDGSFGGEFTGNPKANPRTPGGGYGDDNIYSFEQ